MKKTLASFLFILFFLSSCKKNVFNEKTPEHENIPASNLFIIPPVGFEPAKTYSGFQYGNVSISLQKREKSLEEFFKPYSKEGRKLKKLSLTKKEEVRYGDYEGLFLVIRNHRKHRYDIMLALDVGEELLILKSNFLSEYGYKEIGEAMENSILSLHIDKEMEIPEGGFELPLPFEIDQTVFQFAGKHGEGRIFTKDGLYPTQHPDSIEIELYQSRFYLIQPKELTTTYTQELWESDNFIIESSKEIKVRRLTGWEVVSWLTDENGDKVKLGYMAILHNNMRFSIQTKVSDNFEENLRELRLFVHSISDPKVKNTHDGMILYFN